MTTSGTYNFDPSLGEMVLYAYNLIGIRNTSITQEHMEAARMASNMVLANWSNKGVNLWTVDLQTVPLVAGQKTYSVPQNTVVMLDAYITIDNGGGQPIDRLILPISRTEYASYPNKDQEGFPTVYWQDRLINGNVTLWPVPDGQSAQYLKYYRAVQLQDSEFTGGQTIEIPYLWLDAFADALSYRLARVWNPAMAPALKLVADESYNVADNQNVETAQQYISPQIYGYYRP
jgi:hypothetical protein